MKTEDGFAVASVEDNGIGLGLTIARPYNEAQGGRIELKRAGKRGTIFRIYLPAAEDRQDSSAAPTEALA